MTTRPLRHLMTPCIELRYPDFEKQYQAINPHLRAYAFEALDGRVWYDELKERIFHAILHHKFLPVYRMCDGEFIFSLGYQAEDLLPFWRVPISRLLKRVVRKVLVKSHRSGSREYGYESYSAAELEIARNTFVNQLNIVARKGILAICLHNTPLSEPYVPAILDWFDSNQIPLHRYNYHHFYGLYVLMHGPDRFALLSNQNVLVVTGLTPEKEHRITAGLHRLDVASVQFLAVSSHKAMLDKLDLSSVRLPVDIVLVGAGVGSVNILAQLEPLQTACLDVGFALSTLVDSDLRWNRPFCVSDNEFDASKAKWLKRD